MIHKVILPKLSASMEKGIIGKWLKKEGDKVGRGEVLYELSTEKAVFEVEAETSGILRKILVKEGEESPILSVIGLITEQADEKLPPLEELKGEKIEQSKVCPVGISFKGEITLDKRGKLDEKFIRDIGEDESFKNLSSEEKIKLYKKHGAVIEEGVKIGKGTIILSEYLRLEKDVSIGKNNYIKTQYFEMGRMAYLGNDNDIVCRVVKLGDVSFSDNGILIGGGGSFGPNSTLIAGSNCLISGECIINTSDKVILGNNVGLSPRVSIYTHSHWQNVLKGYLAQFGPVIIGDDSYITGNVLIVPGVEIGKGSMVLGNSLVATNIPDNVVFGGVPAEKIKDINTNLTNEKKDQIMTNLIKELKRILEYNGLKFEDVYYSFSIDLKEIKNPIILGFEFKNLSERNEEQVLFDLNNFQIKGKENRLSDEVRNFLRKRGIKFKPIYWRYIYDKGLFN